jgi:membrane-bound metal-dependent hydrolase YbcI (DUF457 family)
MTIIGHCLAGMSLGLLVVPLRWRITGKLALVGALAVLAVVPDINTGWGMHRWYQVRHSLLVNACIVAALAATPVFWPRLRRAIGGWPVIVAGGAAVFSHLLLDCTYNHGRGLILTWPWEYWSLALPLPWFETRPPETPWPKALRIWTVEACFYGAVFCAAILTRRLFARQPARAPAPGQE